MDIDEAEVDWETILKKPLSNEKEKCEVIVLGEKPLELRFHKKIMKSSLSNLIMAIGTRAVYHSTSLDRKTIITGEHQLVIH